MEDCHSTMDDEKDAAVEAIIADGDTASPHYGASSHKQAFLATFTPEEHKSIMEKVDRRFLLLIGILYMTKNVSL